ncbi:MAG: hypothetical protein KJP21_04475, partial [Bacteroidia bacterium]|nr:hypothetical protein [Bacteroidia bacterium]
YKQPSYNQFNIDYSYSFHKKFEGLELRFLYVYRRAIERNLPMAEMFNQVDFNQINLVANFNFTASVKTKNNGFGHHHH